MLNKNKNKYHNPVILSGREGSMDSSAKAFRMTTEGGRSMVEMLGVLAVIGVLSVGGIAGYTMAMNKYKANEIVNGISMMYMAGMSVNKGQGNVEMKYSTTVGVVPTGASEITYKTDKTVVAAITDTGVCDQVKNQLGDKATGDCGSLTVTLGDTGSVVAADLAECPTVSGQTGTLEAGKYCVYTPGMSWTEAYDLCASLGTGHGMVSLSDFGCSPSGCTTAPSFSTYYFWVSDCADNDCKNDKSAEQTSGKAYSIEYADVYDYSRGQGLEIPVVCK